MINDADLADIKIARKDCNIINNFISHGTIRLTENRGIATGCHTFGYFWTNRNHYYCATSSGSDCGTKNEKGIARDRRLTCPCLHRW